MNSYFITAIGTEIGKTYIGTELLKSWRSEGRQVSACKPLMSGFAEPDLGFSDAGELLKAMDVDANAATVSDICMHRFEAPIAPNVAMRQAGVAQNYNDILEFARASIPTCPSAMHIIEGAGGLMSPVTDNKLHVDLISDLGIPVILVAANYLGAVSQTLSAIECLQVRGIEIAALVVSQPDEGAGTPSHLMHEVGLWKSIPMCGIKFGEDANDLVKILHAPRHPQCDHPYHYSVTHEQWRLSAERELIRV